MLALVMFGIAGDQSFTGADHLAGDDCGRALLMAL